MTPATFLRQRNRIEKRFPAGRKREAAIAHLVRDAEAVLVIADSRVVAYQLPSGKTVCVKRRYATLEAAGADMERIQSVAKRAPQRAYSCAHCMGFHLTSQKMNHLLA